ncbi:MAG: thiamine phosphate synthase [Acidobacteriota bacterium]
MKALWVTDRRAVGDDRFASLLSDLAGLPGLAVELRERGSTDRVILGWAVRARAALGHGVRLSVNRRFDLALAAGAAGVHLPADGLPIERVRANTPRGFRIGVSTHSGRDAAAAIDAGADDVVVGPVFETSSKAGMGSPLGPRALAELPPLAAHGASVYAIGGISESNLDELDPWRDRISGVAAIRLFQESSDPRAAALRLSERWAAEEPAS